jgi:hypothetical protein
MSETVPPLPNDELEQFYDQLPDSIAQQLRSTPPEEGDNFNTMLKLSTSLDEGAAELFTAMCESIPDESLPGLVGWVERIEQITLDRFELSPDERLNYPRAFSPNFGRAKILVDGLIAVPIADRNSLRDYLISDQATQALDSHVEENNLYVVPAEQDDSDESDEPDETIPGEIERTNHERKIGPRVSDLPENFELMEPRALFNLTNQHYWMRRDEKYIDPEDTLEDIVNEASDKRLIPLLLCLEEDYAERLKNGSPKPLVQDKGPRKYYVEDGIVWQVYITNSIRDQVAAECRTDASGFFPQSNFRFNMFRDDYIEANTGTDTIGEEFRMKLEAESHSRLQRRAVH